MEPEGKKFAITLAVVILLAAVIAPIQAPGFAQTTTTTTNGSSSNASSGGGPNTVKTLRIGYFPNINHAQAVIGLGNGDFQKALGNNIKVQTFIFNAGPSAIEALLAKKVDVTYVGSNPAINGYVVSGGEGLRIISGATSGAWQHM